MRDNIYQSWSIRVFLLRMSIRYWAVIMPLIVGSVDVMCCRIVMRSWWLSRSVKKKMTVCVRSMPLLPMHSISGSPRLGNCHVILFLGSYKVVYTTEFLWLVMRRVSRRTCFNGPLTYNVYQQKKIIAWRYITLRYVTWCHLALNSHLSRAVIYQWFSLHVHISWHLGSVLLNS